MHPSEIDSTVTGAPPAVAQVKHKPQRKQQRKRAARPDPSAPPVPDSMRTEMVPIDTVVRYWRNPRRKQNIEKIAGSLRQYGWRQPIVVDAEYVVIVGDSRYLGARANNETHVPVWVARDLSEAAVHAYRIADNRIADETEWDDELVRAELQLLQQLGIAELDEATGFDDEELRRYLGGDDDDEHQLEPLVVKDFPPYTWVLVGVPTERYHEIADAVERIVTAPDVFCEITAADLAPPKPKPEKKAKPAAKAAR